MSFTKKNFRFHFHGKNKINIRLKTNTCAAMLRFSVQSPLVYLHPKNYKSTKHHYEILPKLKL